MRPATGPLWVLACVLVLGSCQAPMMPGAEPFVIARADYAVQSYPAAGPPRVEAEFTVRTSRPSQNVPLLPRDFAVLDWRAAGAEVVTEPAHYVLRAAQPGDYRVWLRFLTPLQKPSPGIEEVSIPAVFASSGALAITLPAGTGKLTTVPQAIVSDDVTTGRERRITMFLPSSETLVLRWQKEAVSVALRPSVLAHCEDAFQVKRGLMVRDTVVRCQVQKAPIEELRMAVPAGAAPRAVTGADVLRWSLEDGGRTIAVTLARKVADATLLNVRCEEVIATAPAEVPVLPLVVAGADLQDGLLRLEAAEDLVLTEVSTSGATRSRQAAMGGKAVVGYSYARVPASVVVQVTERQPDVAVATETLDVIEAGVLTVETRLGYRVQRRAIRSVRRA